MASDFRQEDNTNIEEQVASEDTSVQSIDESIDSVIDISSDTEYRLNQERTGVQVVKLERNKTTRKLNSFDLFFVRFWAAIVAAITTVSSAISKGFFKLFKKELPTKYVTSAIALILIIILIVIVLAPFNLTMGDKNTIDIFSNSLLPVSKTINGKTKWGYINKSGREVIPCQFVDAEPFYHNVAFVKVDDNTWRLIGANGKFKGELLVRENPNSTDPVVGDFNNKEKRAWVKLDSGYTYIKTNGNRAFGAVSYDKAYDFSDGYALVNKSSEWYFISGSGKIKSHRYRGAKSFSEGLAAVKKDSGWTFVNTKFKELTNETYDAVTSFENGYAWIRNGEAINLIDKNGKIVVREGTGDGMSGMKPSDKQLKELFNELDQNN